MTCLQHLIHRESKKGDTILLSISLLNIVRFSQCFHQHTQLEICNIKLLIKIPPHVKCVATLPCEMLMFTNRATFCQSLMFSVGVSKLGCTHLIFVDPGVKINGDVLLSQQLLPAMHIRQVSGDFVLQVTRQCTSAHGTRDKLKLLQRETPAFISPDLWPPNSPDISTQ